MALEQALVINTVSGDPIPVMFNPEEYTVHRENNFAQMAVPGLRGPLLQFVHGNLHTLEMELLLDTVEAHSVGSKQLNQAGDDVRPLVKQVLNLLEIEPSTHAPPIVLFVWASFTFQCVLTRVNQKYVMFRGDGAPVRAKLQVSFSEFTNTETEAKEVKRETSDYSRIHIVSTGDTLDGLAYRLLGAARLWRPIAIVNALEDPRSLEPGQRLFIPRLPYRDPDTGEIYDR